MISSLFADGPYGSPPRKQQQPFSLFQGEPVLSSTTADPELPLHAVPGVPILPCMQQAARACVVLHRGPGAITYLTDPSHVPAHTGSPTAPPCDGCMKLQCVRHMSFNSAESHWVHVISHQGAGAPAFISIIHNSTMPAAMQQGRPGVPVRPPGLHVQGPQGAAASPACRASPSMRRRGPPCDAGPPPSPSVPSLAKGPPARWGHGPSAANNYPVLPSTCSVRSGSHGKFPQPRPHGTLCLSSGISISCSADIWTLDVCCAVQSMLDKTHSVLQSLIEADSTEGERSSGDHDALLDKHAPSLRRYQVLLMTVAGCKSKFSHSDHEGHLRGQPCIARVSTQLQACRGDPSDRLSALHPLKRTLADCLSLKNQQPLVRRLACMCRQGTATAEPEKSQAASILASAAPVGSLNFANHASSSTQAGEKQASDGGSTGVAQQLVAHALLA